MKSMNRMIGQLLFAVLYLSCNAQTQSSLSAAEFEKNISNNENVQVLDVRTPGEYFSGHIKNALQADWNYKPEFDRRIAFIDKGKPVYVYCLAGGRSAAAAEKMRNMGYQQVYELSGGINAWKTAGKALEGNHSLVQMPIDSFNTAIKSSKTVLVDFGAPWCPPCKMMEPVLKKLEANKAINYSLVRVDGGKDQDILKAYSVTTLPVFIIFKDGKQSWRKDGIATGKELEEQLK